MTARCLECVRPFRVVPKVRERYCSDECSKSGYLRHVLFDPMPIEVDWAPIRYFDSLAQVAAFAQHDGEWMAEKASVLLAMASLAVEDEKQKTEAEQSGRTVWRYWSAAEEETRAAHAAYAALTDDFWDYV